MNKFAVWTEEELASINGRKVRFSDNVPENVEILSTEDLPASVNWVEKGAVTGVVDQGGCGSCWAFSATGAMTGRHFIKTGELFDLSVQQLMDCSRSEGNEGCKGGMFEWAMDYAKDKALEKEEDYPYTGKSAGLFKCKYKKDEGKVHALSYNAVKPRDVDQMKTAIVDGPVSVAINAHEVSFMLYKHGVITSDCSAKT